jgi:hypothetical protein
MIRTRNSRIRDICALALGGALLAALPGDPAAADDPAGPAALLPSQAVAVVEADDLRALLDRWRGSRLHRAFATSRAAHDMEKSRLYLRLAQNVAELEEAAGVGLSLDRLSELAGRRSALALYDVPRTTFVLVSELPHAEASRGDPLGARGRMAAREHRGLRYFWKEGAHGRASFAVALVGDRLIAGTDLEAFRGALVLAARASRLPVAPGPDPTPLAALPDYSALSSVARNAPLRLWVAQKRVAGTHYFDDYWIFGKESGAGVDAALVAFQPGDAESVETRVELFAPGARPQVALDDATEPGRADVARAVAALPDGPPFAAAWPADAARAAAAIAELLPRGEDDAGATSRAAVEAVLARANPRRAVEVLEPSRRTKTGGSVEHHAALAFALGKPDALDGAALDAALAGAAGRESAAAFSVENGAHVLKLPLVGEWALSWRRDGARLVVATDPAAARRLDAALAAPATAALLGDGAPRLYRLDVARAGTLWRDVTRTLAARDNWREPADAELFEKSVGGLFDVVADTRATVARGWARGARQYVEEVHYLGK